LSTPLLNYVPASRSKGFDEINYKHQYGVPKKNWIVEKQRSSAPRSFAIKQALEFESEDFSVHGRAVQKNNFQNFFTIHAKMR